MTASAVIHLLEQGTDSPEGKHFLMYHGGTMRGSTSPKKGRWEYGPGLYLTTSYELARKYAGGPRRVYLCSVASGTDIGSVKIPAEDVAKWLRLYAGSKGKAIMADLSRRGASDLYPAESLLNLCINHDIRPSAAVALRAFLVEHGVGYSINRYHSGPGAAPWILTLLDDSLLVRYTPITGPHQSMWDLPPPPGAPNRL